MFGKQADSRKETFAVHTVPESTRETRTKAFITNEHLKVGNLASHEHFAASLFARHLVADSKTGICQNNSCLLQGRGTCVNRRDISRTMLRYSAT